MWENKQITREWSFLITNLGTYWNRSEAWKYFNVASRIFLFESKDSLNMYMEHVHGEVRNVRR